MATEFGVSSKIAMRMLRDDGEFLNGPSSSMEPPVARRLRARLAAAAAEELARPAAAPHPTPAPPGTRFSASEPFVAFTRSPPSAAETAATARALQTTYDEAVAADARALRARRQATYNEAVAADDARQAANKAAQAVKDARRRAADADWAAGAGQRASEKEARAERKRVGTAAAAKAAAEARMSNPSRVRAAPKSTLTEGERRRAHRQSVVSRSDTRWAEYGIGKPERLKWEAVGLRYNQAHIPAMCRVFGTDGYRITPDHLSVVLPNGRTVMQEFDAGSNIVQVMDQLAPILKGDFTRWYDTSVTGAIPALRDFAPEKLITDVPLPDDLSATGVPKLADYLMLLTQPSQDERTIDMFNRERGVVQRSARAGHRGVERYGHRIRLYAAAHGVFEDAELTRKLLGNLPLHVIERRPPARGLLDDALRERQFYYLSAAATLAVTDGADGRIPIPEEYDLPSTTGFAVLRDDEHDGTTAGRILIWSHGAGELTASIMSITDLRGGRVQQPRPASARVGSVLGDVADPALALVVAIASATRRPASGTSERAPAPRRRRAGTPVRPLQRLADEPAEGADHVSLIYAPGEARPNGSLRGSGRKADHRWIVREHWRQQPYPSTGESRPVLIKAHESGAPDGDLWLTDRVRVPRSP
ncbi:hypothetical protein [Cryobacterium sp. N22]|uniref:hypothetical protein n=1 Tax=Cryobacterium sp. N22 TaxID=2048290 RepID=UPI000CE5668A|nr:hypothetical protein [Cryobacterium sp. N22]